MNKNIVSKILVGVIFILVGVVVYSNYKEHLAVDQSKIPEDMEYGKEFQAWIINMKKHIDISADEFRLQETNEVFNSAHLTIKSSDNEKAYKEHLDLLEEFKEYDDVRFSPNEFQFLDFRHEIRTGQGGIEYLPNEVYYHGLREDKIIDTKILTCKEERNCFFDRAFFLDNHSFVISRFSRPISKDDIATGNYEKCGFDEVCTYTIKLHLFDLINSDQYVYESNPYDVNLSSMVEYF